jgi:4-hydroxy-2-oxoheptanedioate aldolase
MNNDVGISTAGQRLAARIRSGAPTLGTFLTLGSALATEVCALAGFDWLLVDLEHGAGGEDLLLGQLHAAAAHDVPVIVRVESSERIRTGRILDLGAAGVMFPRLKTESDVEDATRHMRYPPAGDRGVAGYNRARGFGLDTRSGSQVNDSLLGVIQIETVEALECLEAIAERPGVDVLFVGPSDLSYALGVPGQLDATVFVSALERVTALAGAAGLTAGILAADASSAERFRAMGFSFIGVSSDSTLMLRAATATVERLRTSDGGDPARP